MRQYPGIGGDGAAVETLLDDAIAATECGLKYAGPALLEGKSAPIDRLVSSSDGVAIAQDRLHDLSVAAPVYC
jgi:hypothetical protein